MKKILCFVSLLSLGNLLGMQEDGLFGNVLLAEKIATFVGDECISAYDNAYNKSVIDRKSLQSKKIFCAAAALAAGCYAVGLRPSSGPDVVGFNRMLCVTNKLVGLFITSGCVAAVKHYADAIESIDKKWRD